MLLRNNTGHLGAMRAWTDISPIVIWGRGGFVLVQTRTVTRRVLFNESFIAFHHLFIRPAQLCWCDSKARNKEAIFTVSFALKLMFFAEPGVVSS